MYKRILMGVLFAILLLPFGVSASNHIYSIDMDIYIDESGNADVTEVWKVDGDDGSEWYKTMNNLGASGVFDFKVSMDGKNLIYKVWNVDEGLEAKKGYYGVNRTSDGVELCFGKYDYNYHEFTLKYKLSNFVFNTDDSQTVYWKLIDKLSDVDFDNFSVKVSSFYSFPDTLDVWGYGNDGYAYVEDGFIKMSNNSGMDDQYVVLLAKFPLNTFNTSYVTSYNSFDDVYKTAEEGAYKNSDDGFTIVGVLIFIFTIGGFIWLIIYLASVTKYGFKDNKKIVYNEVPMFRDIPCNKDIFYANALVKLNGMDGESSRIFGAIILRWVKQNKIGLIKNEGVFNKEQCSLDLRFNPTFDNALEKDLFDMMFKASKDGILETKEFTKWAKRNYSRFFSLFERLQNTAIDKLKEQGYIYKRANRGECKYKNVMDDTLYDESVKLYGLKKFLKEFSRMDKKEVIEVHLWDEYLMFAYLFGIADKVAKQLKDLYPEVIERDFNSLDFDTIVAINYISSNSVSAASSARAAASSYSSGGGGFSSSGGGGGSFGGGGGGSR